MSDGEITLTVCELAQYSSPFFSSISLIDCSNKLTNIEHISLKSLLYLSCFNIVFRKCFLFSHYIYPSIDIQISFSRIT